MLTPFDLFGNITAGRVLDVATGSGSFVLTLKEGLKEFTEIIGIDQTERAEAAFVANFPDDPRIRFERVDALHTPFPDASFDTVSISNSLHHFDDPAAVLREMLRLLRPGGAYIFSEMYCDGLSETQNTHVLLHHWWAAVDRANGVVHNATYPRAGLVGMLSALTGMRWNFYDVDEDAEGSDPHDPQVLAELDAIFDRYLPRASVDPALQARGWALRVRLHEVGYHNASGLVAVGKKVGA